MIKSMSDKLATVPAEIYTKRYTVELPPIMHAHMRELSRRKRVHIGVVYEEAIKSYLNLPENYMGKFKTLDQRSKPRKEK